MSNVARDIKMSFSFTFQEGQRQVLIAYSFPWSYLDNKILLDELESTASSNPNIYFNRENIIDSCEGRNVDLLTITSHQGRLEQKEACMHGLLRTPKSSPAKFENKRYIFFSGRVHPGEVAASHMLNGLLKYLLSDKNDPRIKELLNQFVFIIMPFLNPDGVYRGHYRSDTNGRNLNRMYVSYTKEKEPTIYAVHRIIGDLVEQDKLYLYLDFHAHANINNIFMFGNNLSYHEQIASCLFPFILSITAPLFDLQNCNFSKSNMDKENAEEANSKDGTGRVAMYKQYGIIRSYTIEAGYNICTRLKKEVFEERSKPISTRGDKVVPNLISLCESYNFETIDVKYFFTQKDYEEMGEEVAKGLLDLIDCSPLSKIPSTPLRNMRSLKLYLAYLLAGENPYRYNIYLRCLLNSTGSKEKENDERLFIKYIEKGEIDQEIIQKRKKNLGPPSRMKRRLIKLKLKKKSNNDKSDSHQKEKPSSLKKYKIQIKTNARGIKRRQTSDVRLKAAVSVPKKVKKLVYPPKRAAKSRGPVFRKGTTIT